MGVAALAMFELDAVLNGPSVSGTFDFDIPPSSVGANVSIAQLWADQGDGRNAPFALISIPSFVTADGTTHFNPGSIPAQVINRSCVMFASDVTRVTFSITAFSETAGQVFAEGSATVYFFD